MTESLWFDSTNWGRRNDGQWQARAGSRRQPQPRNPRGRAGIWLVSDGAGRHLPAALELVPELALATPFRARVPFQPGNQKAVLTIVAVAALP